jgi:alpha-ketoglutarate-dependent taurine dioxygenase
MSAEHPMVRTHPQSRRKGLFVNWHFTASIKA